MLEASARLVGSVSSAKILPELLGLSRRLIAAEAYAVWRLRAGTRAWEIVCAHGLEEQYCRVAYESLSASSALPEAAAVQFEDLETAPVVPERKALYREQGFRSLVAMPLRIGGRVAGTITFYFRQPRRLDARELRAAEALANLSAVALSAAEIFEEQERRRRAADFLSEAGRLLASSLDYRTTLGSVARLAVPRVLPARYGAEGVALFAQRAADIRALVPDVTMAAMDGREASALLKRVRPDVPVIASSGYGEMEAVLRFQPRDLAGFIQKPYTAADLAAKVRTVLGAGAGPAP